MSSMIEDLAAEFAPIDTALLMPRTAIMKAVAEHRELRHECEYYHRLWILADQCAQNREAVLLANVRAVDELRQRNARFEQFLQNAAAFLDQDAAATFFRAFEEACNGVQK